MTAAASRQGGEGLPPDLATPDLGPSSVSKPSSAAEAAATEATATAAPASNAPAGPAGMPPFVPMSLPLTVSYMGAAIMISITQGLGQGFLTANLQQIAGELGATTTQVSWLMAAYLIPRASLPLMLTKVRTQFGLRRFAEIAIVIYLFATAASLFILDMRSALLVQFIGGMASAPLSTLAFLYMLEPLPPQWKMRLGLPLVMTFAMMGPSLARVISPSLFGDAGWASVHLMSLGLAAISLALVYLLPLKPAPRMKVLSFMDVVSWLLVAIGFTGFTVAFVMGPIYWWSNAAWVGWMLILGIVGMTAAIVVELHRKAPLLDVRWLASPAIVHLTITLLLFRLILSEQSAGAPRMFQVLGVTQGQLVPLFTMICVAALAGGLACIPFMKLERVPQFHFIALVLIVVGAWLDSHATIDTRPAQMILSQSMIAFAGSLFMAPAMLRGLMAALARGPNYILSFIIVFISTQSLGGVIGSGLFSTVINNRQAFHMQVLQEELQLTHPMTVSAIAARVAALGPQIGDSAQRTAQAVSLIANDTANQAYVMAYNDAYFLTFLVAALALAALSLHMLRDWMVARAERRTPRTLAHPSADTEVAASSTLAAGSST